MSGTQTRTFAYTGADLTSATNPENGTVSYIYNAIHQVTQRTDALGQQTQYSYDAYGRVTQVRRYTWQFGSLAEDINQRTDYTYDTGAYGQGRLTGVQFGMIHSGRYSYAYTYTQSGHVASQTMTAVWPTGLNGTATYQWDNEGRMTQVGYPSYTWPGWSPTVGPVYGLSYDNVGRLSTLTKDPAGTPTTIATAGYGAAGQMTSLSYLGVSQSMTYNNMLQLTGLTATSGSTLMNMTYNYSATQNNGRITGSVDGVTGENVSYTYDAVNRLTGATAASLWGETYSYDGFGNLTGKTPNPSLGAAPSMSATYDANNHQIGNSYDANGNLTYGGAVGTNYTWDVENRLATIQMTPTGQSDFQYDPSGKRVMKHANPDPNSGSETWETYFYGIGGQKLGTIICDYAMNPVCRIEYNVYFGGKLIQTNLTQYGGTTVVTDRLGSVRATVSSAGTTMSSYFPYGEERTSTSNGRDKFGTYYRDAPGQNYADQRYYDEGAGRFWSADPGGMKTANRGDPGSLNRYSYVQGDPVNFYDPQGLFQLPPAPMGGDCAIDGALVDCGFAMSMMYAGGVVPEGISPDPIYGDREAGFYWTPGFEPTTETSADPCKGVVGKSGACYVDLRGAGADVNRALSLVSKQLRKKENRDCAAWLGKNIPGGNIFATLKNLKVGQASVYSPDGTRWNGLAVSSDVSGFDIVFNDGGGLHSQSLGDLIWTLMHELGHITNAPGFQDEGRIIDGKVVVDLGKVIANDKVVGTTCGKLTNGIPNN